MNIPSKALVSAIAIIGTAILAADNATAAQLSYTYTWDAEYSSTGSTQGDLAGTEWDADGSNNTLLNDGETPPTDGTSPAWSSGNKGIIIDTAAGGPQSQGVTLDLGSSQELEELVLIYSVSYWASVVDFNNLQITIDGGTPFNFNAFPNTSTSSAGGSSEVREISVDLTGNTGQVINLVFTNNSQWAPYSEIEVYGVPEPGSLALLGLGGLMMARRRRG